MPPQKEMSSRFASSNFRRGAVPEHATKNRTKTALSGIEFLDSIFHVVDLSELIYRKFYVRSPDAYHVYWRTLRKEMRDYYLP